uniref:Lipase n=2 Tax=Cacopsylla melanoneura TaxID=428564 RepID=A0A8D8ZRZ9_9HEMI
MKTPELLFFRYFPAIFLTCTLTFHGVFSEFNDSKLLPVEQFEKFRTDEIINYWGYPSEVHKVQTEDGYILTNFRMPNPGGYPILMLHGLTVSSDCWFLRTPQEDFVFLLWKKGYDIWFWNARGNMYSREHVNISFSDQTNFFDFTAHELGLYDTTATIDYILNITGYKQLITLGHSLGTTNVMIAASLRPEYNEKVALSVLWAQSVYLSHMRVKHFLDTAYSIYVRWLDFPHDTKFFIYGQDPEIVKRGLCAKGSPLKGMCIMLLRELSGPNSNQGNKDSADKMMNRIPTGSSIWVIRQMIQNMRNGKFIPLNFNPEKNLMKYGVKKPLEYPIENVTVPTALYYACCNDFLSASQDNHILMKKIPNLVQFYEIPYKKFNHGDFLWAKDSYDLFYKDVIGLIDKYSGFSSVQNKTNPVIK